MAAAIFSAPLACKPSGAVRRYPRAGGIAASCHVCRKQTLEQEPVRRVLAVMRGTAFAEAIANLPGYTANFPGEIRTVWEVFRRAP